MRRYYVVFGSAEVINKASTSLEDVVQAYVEDYPSTELAGGVSLAIIPATAERPSRFVFAQALVVKSAGS